MSRIKWSAVFIGLLLDIGGTMLLIFLLLIAQNIAGVTVLDAESEEPRHLLVQFVFGLAFTVFGGFVAGLVAQRDFVLHGAVVGALTIVLSVISIATGSTSPPWFEAASALSVVPGGAFGGWLASFVNPSTEK